MYFLLSLFILAVFPPICDSIGINKNNCNVLPKDQYIEVGSGIDLQCWSACVHGKIFWTVNSERQHESLSKMINSSLTVLSLRNVTQQTATVQCHSVNNHQVVNGATIRTYSKPRLISCTLHNKVQTRELAPDLLTCSWEHQVTPSLEISYSVLHASSLYPDQEEVCNSSAKTCTVRGINLSGRITFENMNITVRAKTVAWEADSDPKEFNPYHILKIIPPKINVTASSDHLLVEWKRASSLKECHCEVKYSTAINRSTPEKLNKTLGPNTPRGQLTIKTSESCSDYTVSVRCALNEAPWSDWSVKTVRSKLQKSDVRLRLWRKVSEPDRDGVRRVHALWTEIPSTCQDTFSYSITQAPFSAHRTGGHDPACGSSTCDVNQDAHTVKLTLSHNDTVFVEESVYVPAVGESLPQVTDMQTSTREGVILVSWRAPDQPVRGYVIDWTHDGNQYAWKESKHTTATLTGLLDKKPYDITVTPLFEEKTGRGTRALQVCSRVGDPGNVTIHVQAYDRSALVRWSVTSQEVCSGAVDTFTVFYNIQEEPQLSLNVTVAGTERFTTLNDLKPDTQYSVHVVATAHTGTTRSIETLFKTERFGPGLVTAVSICGGVIIVLVLTLGLCCAVRWKKFKETPVPNPGLSSVALWPPPGHQEQGMPPFLSFSPPSESRCVKVYIKEAERTSTCPPAAGCNENPTCEQTEEYVDPAVTPAADKQNREPVRSVETQRLLSPEDFTALLPQESIPSSPYRSQTSVETPASGSSKPYKRLPLKQTEKITPVTIYVTLDMFEQGQGR